MVIPIDLLAPVEQQQKGEGARLDRLGDGDRKGSLRPPPWDTPTFLRRWPLPAAAARVALATRMREEGAKTPPLATIDRDGFIARLADLGHRDAALPKLSRP